MNVCMYVCISSVTHTLQIEFSDITTYQNTKGGARGVVVIIVGNGTRRHEFKSWTRLIAFHMALIPLGKV